MSTSNGEQVKAQEKVTEKKGKEQRKTSAVQAGLKDVQDAFEEEKAEYLERLTRTGMSDGGINLLDDLTDRSLMLGNITDAEYHDFKWWLEAQYLKIKSHFPNPGCGVTGDVRAFVLDDSDEDLSPLTQRQRILIAEMLKSLAVIVSRSIEGFQQEMLVKSINVSEIVDADEEAADGLEILP